MCVWIVTFSKADRVSQYHCIYVGDSLHHHPGEPGRLGAGQGGRGGCRGQPGRQGEALRQSNL